jgi:hypothetical protein
MFPYSELKNTFQESVGLSVANGISKVYVGSPTSPLPYLAGEPVFIYRRYDGKGGQPGYRSCITSYCVVSNLTVVKEKNIAKMTFDEFAQVVRNKTVYDINELREKFDKEKSLVVVDMLYYGYFGAGNNVNWVWLKDNGLWPEGYPTTARLTRDEFEKIMREGRINVQNVIIN